LEGISADRNFPSAALGTVEQGGVGQGGNIEITTGSLSLSHGAQLGTVTRGQGNAGNVVIRARDRVSLNDGAASSSVEPGGIGQGGNIEITTGSLSLSHGAQLAAATRGQGNAGNVTAHISQSVLLAGVNPINGRSSLISSANLSTSTGTGGRIQITAPALTLADGAVIDARTNTARSGGDIILSTDSLNLLNGGQVITTTFSTGSAGNIIIPNADRIAFSGYDSTFIQRRTQFPNAIANVDRGESGLFANTDRTSTGQAGNINITTQEMVVRDNARIALNSQGTGLAGNLNITANSVSLDRARFTAETVSSRGGNIRLDGHTLQLNNSSISAATRSGQGGDLSINANSIDLTQSNMAVAATDRSGQAGNLTISANDVQLNQSRLTAETRSTGRTAGANIILQDIDRFLYLQNGSQISAQAFNRAHGGNITINANQGFVVARTGVNQNNDIIANADQGNGGEVSITAQGILGLEQRRSVPANTTNDIDISSDQGLQGNVTLNIPNTDPSQGLTELPAVPIDATNRLAYTCPNTQRTNRLSNFTVSGRGGLPPIPYEPLSSTDILDDVRLPSQGSSSASQTPSASDRTIVEANGWILGDNGKVTLMATEPNTKSQGFCHLR
jgi:large exoprotein involved in heme utilization and adhesion